MILTARPAGAPATNDEAPFRSWLMAGFEASCMSFTWTHASETGREVDVHTESGHAERAAQDYGLVGAHGLKTVRDALNWKRIEREPGRYDWSSFLQLLGAAEQAQVQVAWDLCHFGLPGHVDPFAADFADRFTAYAEAAARVFASETGAAPVWCPINEISYWAYAGGEHAHFAPHGRGRGHALKQQFARASIAAIETLRAYDRRARFLLVDPVMHTVDADGPSEDSERERLLQFDAWDLISGRKEPELGGRPELLDIVGVNYYANNQWVRGEPPTPMGRDHAHHRALHDLLLEVSTRYGRPMIVSETGAEGAEGADWMRYVAGEVEIAIAGGADIQGLCLYPVMDYPGWTDGRHCPCGLISVAPGWGERSVNRPMAQALAEVAARHDRLQRRAAGLPPHAFASRLRRIA